MDHNWQFRQHQNKSPQLQQLDHKAARVLGELFNILSDNYISKTVKHLANCEFSDEKIIGGECSTPGIISLVSLCNEILIRKKLNLKEDSNILLIGCEGDTDKEMYQKLISQ